MKKAWDRLMCKLFGHWKIGWHRSLQRACSQHPFADGVSCSRCGALLAIYHNDNLLWIRGHVDSMKMRDDA